MRRKGGRTKRALTLSRAILPEHQPRRVASRSVRSGSSRAASIISSSKSRELKKREREGVGQPNIRDWGREPELRLFLLLSHLPMLESPGVKEDGAEREGGRERNRTNLASFLEREPGAEPDLVAEQHRTVAIVAQRLRLHTSKEESVSVTLVDPFLNLALLSLY